MSVCIQLYMYVCVFMYLLSHWLDQNSYVHLGTGQDKPLFLLAPFSDIFVLITEYLVGIIYLFSCVSLFCFVDSLSV